MGEKGKGKESHYIGLSIPYDLQISGTKWTWNLHCAYVLDMSAIFNPE